MKQSRKSPKAGTLADVDSSLRFTTAEVRRRIFIVSPAGEVEVASVEQIREARPFGRRKKHHSKEAMDETRHKGSGRVGGKH